MNALGIAVTEFAERSEVAPATRRYYRDSLTHHFLRWTEEEGIQEPQQLTPDVVERYALSLEDRRKVDGAPLSVATRAAYLRAVRQFLGWLRKRRGVVEVDERELYLPTARRQHREVLNPAELQRLEDAATIERDKLIVRVMADAGCRIGELVNLRVSDLVERERRYFFLRFRGKTGERLTPIPPALHRRLIDYARGKSGRPMRTPFEALFLAHRKRNRGDYAPLTEDGVYGIVKDVAERAAIGRRIHPHLFRHTRITAAIASGMNVVTASEVFGVSVAVIARHYVHQTDEQRYEAVMRALKV